MPAHGIRTSTRTCDYTDLHTMLVSPIQRNVEHSIDYRNPGIGVRASWGVQVSEVFERFGHLKATKKRVTNNGL